MPEIVPARPKWASTQAFARALFAAGVEAGLSRPGAVLLCAWTFHEVGPTESRLSSGVRGYNLTGVKIRDDAQAARVPYFRADTFEVVNGRTVSEPNTRWRAWDSLSDAVRSILSLLEQVKFVLTRAAIQVGDPDFFRLLKHEPDSIGAGAWYTAHTHEYLWGGRKGGGCMRRTWEVCQLLGEPAPLCARITDWHERQVLLRDRAGYAGPIDGDPGEDTVGAVKRLQKGLAERLSCRLSADGDWWLETHHAVLVDAAR